MASDLIETTKVTRTAESCKADLEAYKVKLKERMALLDASIARIDSFAAGAEQQLSELNQQIEASFNSAIKVLPSRVALEKLNSQRDLLLKQARDQVDDDLSVAANEWDKCTNSNAECNALYNELLELLEAYNENENYNETAFVQRHTALAEQIKAFSRNSAIIAFDAAVAKLKHSPLVFMFPETISSELLEHVPSNAIGWVGRCAEWDKIRTPFTVLEGATQPTPLSFAFTSKNHIVIAEQEQMTVRIVTLNNELRLTIPLEMYPFVVATHPFKDVIVVAVRKDLSSLQSDGYVDCYDHQGTMLSSLHCLGVRALCVLSNGDIIVLCNWNTLQRFSPDNGREVWQTNVIANTAVNGVCANYCGEVIVSDLASASLQFFLAETGDHLRTIRLDVDHITKDASLLSVDADHIVTRGLAWIAHEDYYVITQTEHIIIVNSSGSLINRWSIRAPRYSVGDDRNKYNEPINVAVSAAGHIVVSDNQRKHVLVYKA